eukprot:1653202-Pyramimonas_sp.AAC.1
MAERPTRQIIIGSITTCGPSASRYVREPAKLDSMDGLALQETHFRAEKLMDRERLLKDRGPKT